MVLWWKWSVGDDLIVLAGGMGWVRAMFLTTKGRRGRRRFMVGGSVCFASDGAASPLRGIGLDEETKGGRIVVCFASDGSVGEDWDFEMGEREGCLGVVGMGEIC